MVGLGLRVQGSGFRAWFGAWNLGQRVEGGGLRVEGLEWRVEGEGFRAEG